MVSDRLGDEDKWNEIRVLILVVMEYGLGQSSEIAKGSKKKKRVLILVVMEYGLGHTAMLCLRQPRGS